eukprot:UN01575
MQQFIVMQTFGIPTSIMSDVHGNNNNKNNDNSNQFYYYSHTDNNVNEDTKAAFLQQRFFQNKDIYHQKDTSRNLQLTQYTAMVISTHGTIYDISDDMTILNNKNYKHLPIVDMNGYTIMPTFTDAHAHLMSYGLGLYEVDLNSARGIDDVVKSMLSYCSEQGIDTHTNPNYFITAGRWDQSTWTKGLDDFVEGFPTKKC